MGDYKWYPAVTAVFVASLIASNIIAVKLIAVGPLYLAASFIVYPVSYIFSDILTEVYGYARARRVIWLGFGCNLMVVAAIWITIEMPPAPFWHMGPFETAEASQSAFQATLGFTARLLVASFFSYIAGEFLNSFVMAKMKILTGGKHLWMRTIGSTFIGQFADSCIFITLAFFGLMSPGALFILIITQWLIKTVYEALATPLTYVLANFLKRTEKVDHFDRDTDFNPFRWR